MDAIGLGTVLWDWLSCSAFCWFCMQDVDVYGRSNQLFCRVGSLLQNLAWLPGWFALTPVSHAAGCGAGLRPCPHVTPSEDAEHL